MPMEHWDGFWMSGLWIFPVLLMLLMFVSIFVLARVLTEQVGRRDGREQRQDESPLEIAKRRYARGEITKEEYEEIRKTIG